jgi:hypothetical protein
MPFNVLLLPLLGGYVFLTHWNHTRFDTKRYSGERLIFHSAIAGVVFLILSFFTVLLLTRLWPAVVPVWREIVPFPYTGTSFGAFLLGAVGWWPLNHTCSKREKEQRSTIEEWGDHLEELLERALRGTKQVMVTLSNGKVYAGFVTTNINPAFERKYLQLLPTSSGYRHPETRELTFTTDYAQVYEDMVREGAFTDEAADDFLLVIPIPEITSANIFDPASYARFNEAQPPGLPRQAPHEPPA